MRCKWNVRMNYTCIHANRELMHNGYCNLDENWKPATSNFKLNLMQSLRPKEWVIVELEDKLLVQQATGTALLNDSHQRRSDLINGKLNWVQIWKFSLHSLCVTYVLFSYQILVGFCCWHCNPRIFKKFVIIINFVHVWICMFQYIIHCLHSQVSIYFWRCCSSELSCCT